MNGSKCGVCNYDIPDEHVKLHRVEKDKTITGYHMACEGKAKDVTACVDCGQHRLLCDECRE